MQQRLTGLLMLVLLAGCASRGAPAGTGERLGDPALYEILGGVPIDSAAKVALRAYELAHMCDFAERVSLVAEDPNAGVPARFNAVRILGEQLSAPVIQTQNGGYSPVRWVRVVERNGVSLEGEGTSPFHLPPLFAAGTLP